MLDSDSTPRNSFSTQNSCILRIVHSSTYVFHRKYNPSSGSVSQGAKNFIIPSYLLWGKLSHSSRFK